jgi:DNA-binding MarR family transcriptional regulator
MAGKLQQEIKQTKPFSSLQEEAFLNLWRSSDYLFQGLNEALKPAGLSGTQYNILRILRGAGPEGLACREIGERLITRDPDLTRLLDRMEQRELAVRCREQRDRRVVTVRIAPKGLEILEELDARIPEILREQFRNFDEERLKLLIELLESLRREE